MSTVMYAYRIRKKGFWSFFDKIRTEYQEDSLASLFVRSIHDEIINQRMKYREALDDIKKDGPEVKLQVFERGNYFIFRVLEASYHFLNNSHKYSEIEPVFYDGRTDIPSEHKKNIKVADWMDEEIRQGHYFIVYIVDCDDMNKWLWDLAQQWKKSHDKLE